MHRQILLTREPIDEAALQAETTCAGNTGAVIRFLGMVRDRESGESIRALAYEAFDRMAVHQFELIFQQLEERWPVTSVRVVHRVGVVPVNEPSLWVEVCTPHRGEAFAACQYLIDEMKRVVPIWKQAVT